LIDDLYSGQPFGFAIMTWSLIMLGIELIEARLPWRAFWQDWFTAGILILGYLVAGWLFSGGQPTFHSLMALVPQLVLTILFFPIAARLVAVLDRTRLKRWRAR
jgi:rod shape-determining protein MreD